MALQSATDSKAERRIQSTDACVVFRSRSVIRGWVSGRSTWYDVGAMALTPHRGKGDPRSARQRGRVVDLFLIRVKDAKPSRNNWS